MLAFALIQTSETTSTYETLFVYFTGGPNATTTLNQYSGTLWIHVSGNGTAAGTQESDAFYVYTDSAGKLLPPPGVIGINQPHPWHWPYGYNWVLWINGHTAEYWTPSNAVPTYSQSHEYIFQIDIGTTPTQLTFGVGDIGQWDNAGNYDVTVSTVPLHAAAIDINPSTLALKSKGQWITCYIELPSGFSVNDIDISTIRLEGTIPTVGPTAIGDYDSDNIPDLMVKFSRSATNSLVFGSLSWGYATVTVTFALTDGTVFAGDQLVHVKDCGRGPLFRL